MKETYICPECKGSESICVFDLEIGSTHNHKCPLCNGTGEIDWVKNIKRHNSYPDNIKLLFSWIVFIKKDEKWFGRPRLMNE